MSTGTGFNKGGLGKTKPNSSKSNKNQMHMHPYKYLAYKRFGVLNRFAMLLPTAVVSFEEKFAALLVLNYVFQSGQAAIMLQAVKKARLQKKIIAQKTQSFSPCKVIKLEPYLEERFQETTQTQPSARDMDCTPVPEKRHFLNRIFRQAKTAAAVALMLINISAQANIQNDTIWGEGPIRIENNINFNGLSEADVSLRPLDVEETNPDTTYRFISNNNGSIGYVHNENSALPVFIDIIDKINNLNKQNNKIIASSSGEINAYFKEQTKGKIQLYDLQGRELFNTDFNSDKLYFNASNIPSGAYIARIQTKDGSYSKKFIKTNNLTRGALQNPSNNFKNLNEESATYMVKYEKEGFITDSTEVIIGENFDWYDLYLSPIPPLTQDLVFKVLNLDMENLNNALVYLQNTSTGHIDSLRTDNQGIATFLNRPLETEYLLGVGGLEGYKVWEGQLLNIPEEITNLEDTIRNLRVTPYPDQAYSPLNDVIVDLTTYNIREIFGVYNSMLAIYGNLADWWDVESFTTPGQYELLMEHRANFEALTGILHTDMDEEDPMDNFQSPYLEIRWSNYSRGPPETNNNGIWGMTDGPTPLGEGVTINADITLNAVFEHSYWKEQGRLMGFIEGGGNWMSGTGADIDDENLAMILVKTALGQARFMHYNHNISNGATHLKDDFENIDAGKLVSNSNPIYVSPAHKEKYQLYLKNK